MNANDNNEHMFSYKLIDWGEPPPILEKKPIELTAADARKLNIAFGLNFEAKRYIKTGEDEIDHEFMIHGSFQS